jgi:LuxR family maltose regulon positive regulatory protein
MSAATAGITDERRKSRGAAISATWADDGRRAATYRRSTIASQPNTDRRNEPRGTVSLTPAETRVLDFLPTYRTLAAIGTQLGVGRPTVKTHVESIYKKLGATTRAEAVKRAESVGLLPHQ